MADSGMTRRGFIRACGAGAAAAALPRVARAAPRGGKPNVVICLADDITWHDAGCYGSPDARTPNIDRLAAEGMRFTHAFTATAMCAPTRQQLYTGIYPVRNGAYPNHSRVKPGTKSIVHHLKALGYRVGIKGKRHFGPRESFPFEGVGDTTAFMKKDPGQPFCLVYCSHSPHLAWTAGDASAYDPRKLTIKPYMVDTPETRESLTRYFAEITDFDREVGELMAGVRASGQEGNTAFICTSEQGAQFPHGKWTCYDIGLRTALVVRWPERVKAGSVSGAMVQYVDVVPTLIDAAGGEQPVDDAGRGLDGRSFLGVLEGKAREHNEYVYGVHTTRGIISGSPCYPIRSIRTRTHKYIRNLKADSEFRNTLIAGGDKGGYWLSWVERAKTDPHAARIVGMYRRRPEDELYNVEKDVYELKNIAADPANAELTADLRRRLDAWMTSQGDKGVETEMAWRSGKGKGKKKGKKR
ncbi:MAG: sulfatase family protein [Planctomycetota bacterium]